ncbi:MAG: universal stress protein [Thermodesulfobacteriota bacterium]|nr:universal stress protein [Thermodesulfobacteriota bacterium]
MPRDIDKGSQWTTGRDVDLARAPVEGRGEMHKQIVVGIDGSQASMDAVRYLGFVFGKNAEVKIDLMHILPEIPLLFLEPGESMAEMSQIQEFSEHFGNESRRKATSVVEEAKEVLIEAGMAPAKIDALIEEPSSGTARHILALEQEGIYDAIVLGRHGMSAVEQFLMGSVTHKVLQHVKGLPVCVVHGRIEARKMLVTVDGSPNSKRVLDLATWLLVQAGPMEVTVFHVLAPVIPKEMASMWTGLTEIGSTVEQRLIDDAEDMLSQARTYLTENGIPDFAIKTRLETGIVGAAQAILKETQEGGYGTIVLGRRGISRTKRFLFGSVSNKIVQQGRDVAVWVVC